MPANVVPSILIMPNASHVKYIREQRFDRYNNISRSQEMAQELNLSILFSVYEPGVRLPGFTDSQDPDTGEFDLTLLDEGTEEGLFTLTNWMDDFKDTLLSIKRIPGSDLSLQTTDMYYSLYTDQSYVVDKRPIYYGYINVIFDCYVDEHQNPEVDKFLQ